MRSAPSLAQRPFHPKAAVQRVGFQEFMSASISSRTQGVCTTTSCRSPLTRIEYAGTVSQDPPATKRRQ